MLRRVLFEVGWYITIIFDLSLLELTNVYRYDDSQEPKICLVPEMIREIQRIVKLPPHGLFDKGNDVYNISDKVFSSMTSKKSKDAIKVINYKRQLERPSREISKKRKNEYKKLTDHVYTKCGYSQHGSKESSGGGALPLSLKSAQRLAEKFYEIYNETNEPIVILLV